MHGASCTTCVRCSPVAREGLEQIAKLYAIEAEIRRSGAKERLAARQARSAPLVQAFHVWVREQQARVSAKSRLGEKLAYIANCRKGLDVLPR
jgi:transposase